MEAVAASVSVVIVTYRSEATIAGCLRSLDAAGGPHTLRAIVIDNSSDDATLAVVAEVAPTVSTPVEVAARTGNDGFSIACNQGLAMASGDWVLFLNPDTVCPPGSIAALLDVAVANPDAGIVAPALVGTDGHLQATIERTYGIGRVVLGLLRIGGANRAAPPPDGGPPVEVDWVHAAVIVMPLLTARRLGGFDERFFFYGEDMDLCTRVRDAGLKVLVAPEIRVAHIGGASAALSGGDGPMAARRVVAFSRYIGAHQGRAASFGYLALTLLSATVMAAVDVVRRHPSAVHSAMARAAGLTLVGRLPSDVPF